MTIYAEEITYRVRWDGGMFNDWRSVDVEQAKTIASLIKARPWIPEDEKLDYINAKFYGIRFDSLDEIPEHRCLVKWAINGWEVEE